MSKFNDKLLACACFILIASAEGCNSVNSPASRLNGEEEAADSPEGSPRPRYNETPNINMPMARIKASQIVRFDLAYLHCGSASTAYNAFASVIGVGVTYQQALAIATKGCEMPPSTFIRRCEASGGSYSPLASGGCDFVGEADRSMVTGGFEGRNYGGGVESEVIAICRTVYCSPKPSRGTD